MYDKETMILDELEEVIKSLQNGKAPEENHINSELINMHLKISYSDYLSFTTYTLQEKHQENRTMQ
jgi:hypothetical protein